jgi:hypothetical protein
MTVFTSIVLILTALILTAGFAPTVRPNLVRTRLSPPNRHRRAPFAGTFAPYQSPPTANDLAQIALDVRPFAAAAVLFVHAGQSDRRSRTRGLAQHDV